MHIHDTVGENKDPKMPPVATGVSRKGDVEDIPLPIELGIIFPSPFSSGTSIEYVPMQGRDAHSRRARSREAINQDRN